MAIQRASPGTKVTYYLMDLMITKTVVDAVEEMMHDGVHLDLVVCNAEGVVSKKNGTVLDTEGHAKMFSMNTLGHHSLLASLLNHDVVNTGGVVVYASSEAARGIAKLSAAPFRVHKYVNRLGIRKKRF